MTDAKHEQQLLEQAVSFLNDQYESNTKFNDYFDSDEPISIGTMDYPRSKVLFWVDRNAYVAERANWENESNIAKHEDAANLVQENQISAPFRELAEAIERGRIVPFVGAGLSKPMKLPLWGEALEQLLIRVAPPNSPEIKQLIDGGKFLDAAQALATHDEIQTANFINTTYSVKGRNLAGPILLLPRLGKGCLVTTNFDDAIEETFRSVKIEFSAYMHGTQDHNFFPRLVRGDRCLLKLHGDAENQATHILTAAQYQDAYGEHFDFTKPLPKALRQIYISNSMLFLGCGLEQDWTLELFRKVKAENAYAIPRHYAILPSPTTQQARSEKATRLLSLQIQPIWYPEGCHELAEKLLSYLADIAEKRVPFNV